MPLLTAVYKRRLNWDPDPDELWQNIVTLFFEAIHQYGCSNQTLSLFKKIYNTINFRISLLYRKRWRRMRKEIAVEPPALAGFAGAGDCGELDTIETVDCIESAQNTLATHSAAGRITTQQAAILLYTRVIGARLIDYCRHTHLNYELAKKWRQRAEAALRSED